MSYRTLDQKLNFWSFSVVMLAMIHFARVAEWYRPVSGAMFSGGGRVILARAAGSFKPSVPAAMRAVVTGGAGFIGSHLVDALLDAGDDVIVIDDLSSGRRENLEDAIARGAKLLEMTIVDAAALQEVLGSFRAERVFHLAAQIDVRRAVSDPALDATINILGTINMLEAARRCGAGTFVLASTGGAIYGEGAGRDLPLPEDAVTEPETGYGLSKLAAESYVALYRRQHGLAGASLRLGNVYGPRQDPHGEAGVVAIFAGRLARGDSLGVVGDGSQTRDYVYVTDVVSAMLAADDALGGRADHGGTVNGPLNIGTGVETSILALVEALGAAAGVQPSIHHLPERQGEVRRIAIDPSAAASVLGWSPAVDLSDGLRRTYQALSGADG